MKKKVLAAALAVALIAIMVSGSLAYFTANDEVTNTFTIGSVKIEIFENGKATDKDSIPFGKLVPVVNQNPSADDNYFDKVVKVKNTGANDAYIRTHIAIPTALIGYLQLDVSLTGWSYVGSTAAGEYSVYTYDYQNPVAPGEFTTELLKGAYLKSNVDLEENADGNLVFILRDANGNKTATSTFVAHKKTANGYTSETVNIKVASQAIQTQGFENGATAALNSGFGENTNPWQ